MTREQKRKISTVIRYTLLIAVGFIMVYPLIWMVGATFKTNSEIFTSAWFWPKNPVFDGYENAFKNYGGKINLILSMLNTYKIVEGGFHHCICNDHCIRFCQIQLQG